MSGIACRILRKAPRGRIFVQKRTLSSKLSNLLYPTREELPEVTTTTAKEESSKQQQLSARQQEKKEKIRDENDPFDDLHSLSDLERDAIRSQQAKLLPTQLDQHCRPIQMTPPANIPPNLSMAQLEPPQTMLTTLDNGIRVVSQETYGGPVSTIGILGNFGSRQEEIMGTAHLLEATAFQSTKEYASGVEIQQLLQEWGGSCFAHSGREQTLWCLDILRPNVEAGMELLKQVVLEQPLLTREALQEIQMAMGYQVMDLPSDVLVTEALQLGAYGAEQQLGKRHYCPLEDLERLTPETLQSYFETHVYSSPKSLVVAGAGVGHDELVDMAQLHFGHLKQTAPSDNGVVPSIYKGGSAQLPILSENPIIQEDGHTKLAIAVEVDKGWHNESDLVPACVLQTLLGGGNSFSAGGPGKGMYSRLYRQVLNRYYWAESAEGMTSFHEDSGLLGISGSSPPTKSRDLSMVLADQLLKLSTEEVQDEELERAKNMLRGNVLSQLESRLVLFEDMGRQVLTYGRRETNEEMCLKIDSVTKQDILNVMQKALAKPPTLAAVGMDMSKVPAYDEVKSWFNNYK